MQSIDGISRLKARRISGGANMKRKLGAPLLFLALTCGMGCSKGPLDNSALRPELLGTSLAQMRKLRPRMANEPSVMRQYKEIPESGPFERITWHFDSGEQLSHVDYRVKEDLRKGNGIEFFLTQAFGKPTQAKTKSTSRRDYVKFLWVLGEHQVTATSTGTVIKLDWWSE